MAYNDKSIHAAEAEFDDPLLGCLEALTRLKNQPFSREALIAGLPLRNNRLTPDLFIRAAERAGFYAKVIKRPLRRITRLVLPVVLLLRGGHACVLKKINDDDTVDVIFPETEACISKVDRQELEDSYSGYCIFVKNTYDYESRADEYNLDQPKQWFWGAILKYNSIYARVMITVLLINLFALATPLFVMKVYDSVVPNNAIETLWMLAIGVLIIICFDFILKILRGYFIDAAGKKADIRLASRLFSQVLNIRMEARPVSSGAFANNIKEFEVLRDFFTSATLTSVIDLPFIFIFIGFIYLIGGSVAYIPLIAVPILLVTIALLEIPMRREVGKAYIGATHKHAVLIEAINGFELIKGMGAESAMQNKYEQSVAQNARSGERSRRFSTLATSLTATTQQIVTVLVVVYGVYLIQQGLLSIGGLIACTILAGRSLAPLAQLVGVLVRFQQSRIALQGLNKVMELPVERPYRVKFLRRPQFEGEIEFVNVSFTYPKRKLPVLNDISFKLNFGERVGLIGGIGSGKSTLLKMLLEFYTPSKGNILLDGIDAAQIDPADLRRNIGYVPQEQLLLYGTVRDNITLRTPWADDNMVLEAARLAGVDRFMSRNPAGYQMLVGERGDGLSGGQRQAIMLARGVIASPSFLLFDEPTSAMDNRSEHLVIQRLKDYVKGKTLLLVTHKISMLELVDRLIVVEGGKIIADGPKERVLAALAKSKPTAGAP